VIPELALLFPRAHLVVSASFRYQVVTGTTDVYTPQRVFHARDSAYAFFQKIGWFPRAAAAHIQPYIAASSGVGRIAHLASLTQLAPACGPNRDQQCVDTVSLGPYFLGGGGGVRFRLADHLDALLAVDAQVGFHGVLQDRGYNVDVNLGVAAVF
jgi:hypothetical protein